MHRSTSKFTKNNMSNTNSFTVDWLLDINTSNFDQKAIQLFHHQYESVPLYREYCQLIGRHPSHVNALEKIPFLPISFFKTHSILATGKASVLHFESSGTTGMQTSKHFVARPELYENAFLQGFNKFYGNPEEYVILGLLPSYLERSHSSLVYMVNDLIEKTKDSRSGFYLNEWEALAENLSQIKDKKVFLIGVTFGLLDFADAYEIDLSHCIVMETGGMKGRREEWTRNQVHDFLKERWNLKTVHSEYGMSEMLSQAYSKGDGVFECSQTMKVLLREENDPLSTFHLGSGLINVIDLANIDSCAFIASEDIGKIRENNLFEVLGRRDAAALRGCSLMVV